MASAVPHNRAVQCTHESLLDDQNIMCVPPRAATEAPPNNTSSARAARVGGDQCGRQCEQRASTDGAGQTTAAHPPIQCSEESEVDHHITCSGS